MNKVEINQLEQGDLDKINDNQEAVITGIVNLGVRLTKLEAKVDALIDVEIPEPEPTPEPEPIPTPTGILYGVNMDGLGQGGHILKSHGTYGHDYPYPGKQLIQHFGDIGCRVMRLTIRHLRLQHQLGWPLDDADIGHVKQAVADAYESGQQVLIEPHDFGRYYDGTAVRALGDSVYSRDKFADFWQKMALTFKGNPGVWGLELTNEPYGLPGGSAGWVESCQACVTAIRQVDEDVRIVIPGYDWGNANKWLSASAGLALLEDPSNNLVFDAHDYLDPNMRGEYNSGMSPEDIGVQRFSPFVSWLRQHNLKGIVGETGCPATSDWLLRMRNLLDYLSTCGDVIEAVLMWCAGPWWPGNYPLKLNPINGVDRPQIELMREYI